MSTLTTLEYYMMGARKHDLVKIIFPAPITEAQNSYSPSPVLEWAKRYTKVEGKRYIFGWGPATALFYGVVIFGLIVLGTVATIKWNDWFGTDLANSRTNVIRESNENVQSKQVQLVNLIQQWNRLETEIRDIANDPSRAESVATRRNQQSGMVDSICQLKVTLPGDQLPDDVARFLATHPCTGSR